ncbi:alkane 1-monooxygenase [Tabrizicola oligotrophica]|uniref:Alkane 1-monooxygenase n=1 Tax=Tabrizicola oligotrophica TaxID=2710650 RepID=A0A6M0QT40_9RHOB|nr:alkane 1-monooxygenase [Tabrizicola oligotrophica]NEY90618.1 alkane 1-monooxygenase [Tabrizicola oligotrophica]
MVLFALASASPLVLFALGLWAGGGWAFAGLLYMTVLAACLDQISGLFPGDAPEGAEFPAADGLLVGLALGHLVALPLVVWGMAGGGGLGLWGRVALFLGAGLWFGQVSNPMAHELIHRGSRGLYGLGVAVYASLLFGHHASAHRLVHHRHAASAEDPNSARAGEGFYRFFLRAWGGSFVKGWQEENALRARAQGGRGLHPYAVYFGGAAAALMVAFWIAGGWGVVAWGGLALHAQMQLMLSDYVQHYGLTRARRDDGRLEPVAARHSWNAPHWFSSSLMLNAPRHSDHHAHPTRPYPALRLPGPEEAPHLPWPLPVACTLALVPPLWKRAIRPHLARWRLA